MHYFHLVFSVPHTLVPLMWQNKKILFALLFEASAATLLELAADAGRGSVEDLVGFRQAHRHGVDQNIAVIARVEIHRAADGRNAKTIAIGADPGNDSGNKMARPRMVWRAQSQEV